jgi:hypothetical protein
MPPPPPRGISDYDIWGKNEKGKEKKGENVEKRKKEERYSNKIN